MNTSLFLSAGCRCRSRLQTPQQQQNPHFAWETTCNELPQTTVLLKFTSSASMVCKANAVLLPPLVPEKYFVWTGTQTLWGFLISLESHDPLAACMRHVNHYNCTIMLLLSYLKVATSCPAFGSCIQLLECSFFPVGSLFCWCGLQSVTVVSVVLN